MIATRSAQHQQPSHVVLVASVCRVLMKPKCQSQFIWLGKQLACSWLRRCVSCRGWISRRPEAAEDSTVNWLHITRQWLTLLRECLQSPHGDSGAHVLHFAAKQTDLGAHHQCCDNNHHYEGHQYQEPDLRGTTQADDQNSNGIVFKWRRHETPQDEHDRWDVPSVFSSCYGLHPTRQLIFAAMYCLIYIPI